MEIFGIKFIAHDQMTTVLAPMQTAAQPSKPLKTDSLQVCERQQLSNMVLPVAPIIVTPAATTTPAPHES